VPWERAQRITGRQPVRALPLPAVHASPTQANRTRPAATAAASRAGVTSWRPLPSERISTGRPSRAISCAALAGALAASSSAVPRSRAPT
jgi:hypothetical protein